MQKIKYKGKIIGIKIGHFAKGSRPQTRADSPLQILSWNHKKGYKCEAHTHKPTMRLTARLSECFVVQKGKLKFRLFGDDGKYFKTIYLKAGDIYLYVSGGHEVEVVEDVIMFEVKNGPYIMDKVKI
jgi:hypothetical protein